MALCARCGQRTEETGEFCSSCGNAIGSESAGWPRTGQRAAADYLRPFAPEGAQPTALRSIEDSGPWAAGPSTSPEPGAPARPSPSGQLPDFPQPGRLYGTASGRYGRGRAEPLSPATGSPSLPYAAREADPEASQDLFDTPTDPFRAAPDPYRQPPAPRPDSRPGDIPADLFRPARGAYRRPAAEPGPQPGLDPRATGRDYEPPAGGGYPDPPGPGDLALPGLPDAADTRYQAAPATRADQPESAERGNPWWTAPAARAGRPESAEPWWTASAAGAAAHDPLAGISEPGHLQPRQRPVPPPARPAPGDATVGPPAGYAGPGLMPRPPRALPSAPQPGWPADGGLTTSPGTPPRARGLSSPLGRWVAAAVIVVLVCAGGAALLLARHGQPPSTSGSGARKPASTPAATSLKDGLLSVTTAAASAPHAAAVERFLVRYFTAINDHDYAAYRRLFSTSLRGGLSAAEFSTGYGSSQDSQETLRGISAVPAVSGHAPELQAQVTFDSRQSPASSPTHSACTAWTIAIYLVKQGSGYAIVSPPASYQATFGDC
jgi:hypothetical protein